MSDEKKLSPFDFLNSINDSKVDILNDENEKQYAPFIVNKSLSYFTDTVFYSNELNQRAHVDNRLQYDFLRLLIKKRKRFSKWDKADTTDNLELLKSTYGYSSDKARAVLPMFTEEALNNLRKRNYRGGKK